MWVFFSKMSDRVLKYGKVKIAVVLMVLFVLLCLVLNIYYLLAH